MVKRDDEEKSVTGMLYITYIISNLLHIFTDHHFPFLNLDTQLLNLALSLELLEKQFYKHGLSRYSREDFKKAGYPEWVRGRFEQIYEHEKTHVQFLESALTAAGAEYVKPCEYILCAFLTSFFSVICLIC